MSDRNKDLMRRFVKAGNSVDLDALDDIMTSDFVRHCEATPDVVVNSREDFKEFLRETVATFPDQHVVMEMLISEGDKIAFWGTFSGTQKGVMGPFPATGKFMKVDISGVFRVQDGKLAEEWVTWDNLAGLIQLGLFP
ncbi:MAG: ester cyclase [Acidobacteriota bacterium]|nr:MAG: ester cyclase [Acidobacteriota bacterium]